MTLTASHGYDSTNRAPDDGLQRLIFTFRRRLRLFSAVALAILAATVVWVLSQPTQYVATATVGLNNKKQPAVAATPNSTMDQPPDSSAVDTEVEILRSRTLAERVVREMNLDRDPDFNPKLHQAGMFGTVANFISGLARDEKAQSRRPISDVTRTTDAVMAGLRVNRAGLTYLININFTAGDAAKAARVANGFARAYLTWQLDNKSDASNDAKEWLGDRLNQLRSQAEAADTELQHYKIANNLLSAQGATLTEQEISTLDQQLALTRAQEAEATARLQTARRQLASGSTGEDVGEALSSPVIQQLRQQRAVTSKTVADLQGRYGERHPEMLKAKRELADLDGQIQSEIQRIISNLEAQAQVARQRTASIQASVGQSRNKLVGNNRAVVRLNELQRNADAARALYETMLNRYKEASIDKGLKLTDAHIVTAATVPMGPSDRKNLQILFGILVALAAGGAAIMIAELLDNAVADGEMIEGELEASYLGSVPLLESTTDTPELARIGPERFVIERPLSNFTETIRSINASVQFSQLGRDTKIVAITSSLPGEGKTTTSICLTRTLALAGKSVVLVDCDLRQRSVNRIIGSTPKLGLIELLNGDVTLDQALVADDISPAAFLPLSDRIYTPRDVFGSKAMSDLLAELRKRFDVIILDTAPVLLVTDTRTLAAKADACVMLVHWRKTSKRAVGASLKLLRSANATLSGVALTQVDLRETSSILPTDPSAYYKAYKKYYAE
jgi:polysaccharide biosynthesis transport protein